MTILYFLGCPDINIRAITIANGVSGVDSGVEWPAINNQVSGWNFWVDARAAAIVFSSGVPVRLVPLDVTALHGIDPLVLTANLYENYKHQSRGIIGNSMTSLMRSWLDSYVTNEKTDTLTKAVPIWDVVAGMVFHHPEIGTEWQECRVKISEGSDEISGQVVTLDSGTPNVRICLKGNQVLLDSLLLLTSAN